MNITDIQGKVTLSNGVEMPYFGLGTWRSQEGREVIDSVSWALEAGYRHIDTAAIYQNESGVGKAIHASGISRKEVFVVSKVWNGDQGFDTTLRAYERSLKKTGLEYLDLYLIHWPVKGKYRETWRALEKIYAEGRVRAIGVSNFLQHQLEDLLQVSQIVPMVDQMEFHPWLIQPDLIEYCRTKNIRYEAWSPLMRGMAAGLPALQPLAGKYGKTPAQIVLRWNLQKGIITIPKSVRKERILENAGIFDFHLSLEDMLKIDSLDRNERIGPDPDTFTF